MEDLMAAAQAIRAKAYAPYSSFHVGAALRTPGGRVFTGTNVENAAYPLGTCAEAGAIAAMVAAGETRIVEVAIAGSGEGPCVPCGGCRQRLAEFAAGDVPVRMSGTASGEQTVTLGELIPLAFTLKTPAGGAAAAQTAADVVRDRAAGRKPRLAILLGSGLGALTERLDDPVSISYADLPGFPVPGIAGHAGELVIGRLAGVPVALLSGRVHAYEGRPAAELTALARQLPALGIRGLLLTSAVGSLKPDLRPGGLLMVADHLNMMGTNPLVGANDPTIGPRFVDLTELYDPAWRTALAAAARLEEIALDEGVYAAMLGPSFETPAEIRALRTLGADVVGMSMVPDAITARHCGLRVGGLCIVTNMAAGMHATQLDHAGTLKVAGDAVGVVGRLLASALPELERAFD